jgi:cytochrome b subunit of formate dehydrogenase
MQVLSGIREEGCVRWTPLNPGRSLPEAAPSTRRFTPNRPRLALYVVLAALLLGGTAAAEEIEELVYTQSDYEEFENDDCLECHGDEDIEADTERGEELELYVEDEVLLSSVHEEQLCTDCHRGAQDFEDSPHNEGEALGLNCSGSGCHGEVVTEYDRSIHGKWHAKGDEEAATCKDCHGNHSILSSSDRKSRTNKFNLHKTCAECHSRISRETVPKTCGECHVLVEEIFNASVHGESVNSHDVSAPHCTSCHKSHVSEPPFSPEFRLHADRMCGECHEEQLVGYRDTFHGKAIALGRGDVAACYDCHGHHDIVKIDNPTSRLSDERRVETCKQCHEDANPNFANYIVHADHNDREAYPQLYYVFWGMTALLVGTFAFFALHTLLWLYRSMALYMSDSREWREAKTQVRGDTEEFTRFTPLDRFLHGLVIVSFLLLVITGMPLKFYYTDWARVLLDLMGGQAVAAVLHRIGAIITIFYFTVHVTSVLYGIFTGRKRFENPETGKIELRRTGRAFFGKGPKPQFDRWTYWEKFDYMAVFWGVAMIGVSGLIMWFPEFFTRFLPGWSINVALIIHSDEALLAAGFIFTFHFFNVHFRPDKFPMDSVMFSGRMSKSELMHERKKLYDRWVAEGTLEQHRAGHEWDAWKKIALPAGFTAFLVGVVLMLLIYVAMASRLLGG